MNKNVKGYNTLTDVRLDNYLVENDLNPVTHNTCNQGTIGNQYANVFANAVFQDGVKVVSTSTAPLQVSNGNESIKLSP